MSALPEPIEDFAPPPARRDSEAPHAADAERAILGALMMNNDLFTNVEGQLKEDFFYDRRHRLIFRTLLELYNEGHADPTLLTHRLSTGGKLADCGGADYIAALPDIGAAPVNMKAYIDLMRETACLRMMINAMNESTQEAFHPDGKQSQKLLDMAEARLSQVSELFMRDRAQSNEVKDIADEFFKKIARVIKEKDYDSLLGLPTGFRKLDYLTTGLHEGDLVILAGRPGQGKTTFALNLVRHVSAQDKVGVLCFSLEMSAEQLTMRMIAHGGVDSRKFRTAREITAEDLQAMANECSMLEKRSIYIEDTGTLNVLEARAKARRIKRELAQRDIKLGLIMIDYLQMMDGTSGERIENRALEISAVSRGLKSLAKELKVPVLALAQLNRAVEARPKRRPQLSDLRDSGAIEQDADLILFLYSEDEESDREQQIVERKLLIGKHRNGPTGLIDLTFHKSHSKFLESAGERESAYYADAD